MRCIQKSHPFGLPRAKVGMGQKGTHSQTTQVAVARAYNLSMRQLRTRESHHEQPTHPTASSERVATPQSPLCETGRFFVAEFSGWSAGRTTRILRAVATPLVAGSPVLEIGRG